MPQKTLDKSLSAFRSQVRSEVRRLWTGQGDIFDFFEGMDSAIASSYERAWTEGARECGIEPGERTVEEEQRLAQMIATNRQYIFSFGEVIEQNSRENGGKLTPLMSRANMWVNRYEQVKTTASQMACGDIKKKWVWNPLKEHCKDCRKLNGRVYRNSVWLKYGIQPRSPELACFGGHCGCDLIETDEPVTPGRPPAIG